MECGLVLIGVQTPAFPWRFLPQSSEMSPSWNIVKIKAPRAFETLMITFFFESS